MNPKRTSGPSLWGWALLLLVLITAVSLRFINLGDLPPGLYRDEAYNGIDALRVLNGEHALFFKANNGREPAYIYLTALFVGLLGRTAVAVRVGAAVAGAITTIFVYLMAREWFNQRVGLLSAWLWAMTLWTVHMSRIGLRPVLLPLGLALTGWLAALAFRRNKWWLWLLAGMAYGFSFYTYLAVRFTPILLVAIVAFLWWRGLRTQLWPGILWFGVGTAVFLTPWLLLFMQQPDLILGRTGQVSILNANVNGGNVVGAVARHVWQGVRMFLWQGDSILRHNPAGRPVFDWVMAGPFLWGMVWCVRNWRKPAAMSVLLWTAIMLGPTILSEDTPHFLRASGLLPGVLLLPAIGLDQLWQWSRVPQRVRQTAVCLIAIASLFITVQDYWAYGRDEDVAFMFEASVLEMAEQVQAEQGETAVFMDRWFWDEPSNKGWATIPYIVDLSQVQMYRPETGLAPTPGQSFTVYAWELGSLDFVPTLFEPPALVTVERGDEARLDFQDEGFPLYARYEIDKDTATSALLNPIEQLSAGVTETIANFGNQFWLRQADVAMLAENELAVTLYWEAEKPALSAAEVAVTENWVAFVHVLGADGLVGQDDALPGVGLWSPSWWQPGIVMADRHLVTLAEPFDPNKHQISVGLYDAASVTRLPVYNGNGEAVGDSWLLPVE